MSNDRQTKDELREKLEAIVATPEFKLTGPIAMSLISALLAVKTAMTIEDQHNRRLRSLGSTRSGQHPPNLTSQLDSLVGATDNLINALHEAAMPVEKFDG